MVPSVSVAPDMVSPSSTICQLPRFWSKEFAPSNMPPMLVTAETFQPEMSPLKAVAPLNMSCMSVTAETFHVEMSPLKD